MSRLLGQLFYVVVVLAIVVMPTAVGWVLLERTRAGIMSRAKGVGLYALAVLSPSLLFVSVVFALIGVEELTGLALVTEEMARSLPLVVGLGLAVGLSALVIYVIAAFRSGRALSPGVRE